MTWACDTCRDTQEIDETLGGISTSNQHAPCPDCVAPQARYVPQKPRPCLCQWLGCIGIKCRAHSGGTVSE